MKKHSFFKWTILRILILKLIKAQQYTPVFISEIFNHGSRTPLKNTLKIQEFTNLGIGKITPNGLRQQFLLGKQILKNYQGIFSPEISPFSSTFLYSQNFERCIFSAQAHLLGIFPLGTGEKTTSKLKAVLDPPFEFLDVPEPLTDFAIEGGYFPIPYNVQNSSKDLIFMDDIQSSCPLLNSNLTRNYLERVKDFEREEGKKVIQELDIELKAAGFDPRVYFRREYFSFENIVEFWDSVTAYFYYFGANFKSMSDQLYNRVSMIASLDRVLLFEDEYLKLYTTKIMEIVLDNMDDFVDGNPDLKYIGFSGSDSGIMPFLLALGLTSKECIKNKILNKNFQEGVCELIPSFSSNLIFELNKNTQNNDRELYVRILYNGEPVNICTDQKPYCKFSEFVVFANQKFIEGSFNLMCMNTLKDYKTATYIIINVIILGMIIALSVYVSRNRSKIIKIGGVNRLVEVFSDNATMKNVIRGYHGEDSISDLEEIDEEEEEKKQEEERLKSYGVKKRGLDDESIDYGLYEEKKHKTVGAKTKGKRRFSADHFFT